MATDCSGVFRYKTLMSNKSRFSTKPSAPMNQWVRDAVEHYGQSMAAVADELNKKDLRTTYDRAKVQKMTTVRRVTIEEAQAISEITGFPLSEQEDARDFLADYLRLPDGQKSLVHQLIQNLRTTGQEDAS